MAEINDVYITGIDTSLEAWGTEATAKAIHSSLRQANADTTGILRLLGLLGNKAGVSEKELMSISAEIAKGNVAAKEGVTKVAASTTAAASEDKKQTTQMTSLLSAFSATTGQLNKNAREQAKRDSIRDDLIEAGMSGSEATAAANSQAAIAAAERTAAKVTAFIGIASTFMTTSATAVRTGYKERFDMAGDMRQSGLFAGMDAANQGFISIAKTISETNFTFGEAAEFTKRFSQAVGVTGVKSALDFSNAMAFGSLETGAGYMERFSMDFGQVANMSGQYLESLRASGQLSSRSDAQIRTGMDSFMSNVQMTANVLKISMEEAAELMQKSVSPAQAGRMATLTTDQRTRAESAMLAMNVQSGPIGDAIAARLSAGSDANFLLMEEYSQMMSLGALGMEGQEFVSKIAGLIENGDSGANWKEIMAAEMQPFADNLVETARLNQAFILADDNKAAFVGSVNAMAQTYLNSAKEISGGGEEDKTQMLSEEQQRRAARLAEKALNAQMGHFTEQLKLLTNTLDLAARRSYDWMESHEGKIAASASAGRWLSEVWPSIVTFIAASTSTASVETIDANVDLKKQELDMANQEYNEILANPEEYSTLQKIRAENGVINATRAYNIALEAKEDFNTDAAIDVANEKKVTNRAVATKLITDQMSDAVITDERYDTSAEVNSKIAELEQLLKAAEKDKSENLGYITDFWKGGTLESSAEAREASKAQVSAINKLITKFEDVLDALK
jgi:hypothetical protein